MEVKLGELAGRNGSSSEVKEFGAHMVRDHTRLHKELGAAATSIGLTVPTDLSEDQKTEYTKLSKLSGKSFDKEYTDLMVKDQKILPLSRRLNQRLKIQNLKRQFLPRFQSSKSI